MGDSSPRLSSGNASLDPSCGTRFARQVDRLVIPSKMTPYLTSIWAWRKRVRLVSPAVIFFLYLTCTVSRAEQLPKNLDSHEIYKLLDLAATQEDHGEVCPHVHRPRQFNDSSWYDRRQAMNETILCKLDDRKARCRSCAGSTSIPNACSSSLCKCRPPLLVRVFLSLKISVRGDEMHAGHPGFVGSGDPSVGVPILILSVATG